jgi:predicted glycosyltransferase involved in capsule biosynthesis
MLLNNLTFIIPLGIETQDRLRNFLFTISYLLTVCPSAKFIIHEMGDVCHIDDINHPSLTKMFTKTPKVDKIFYKTWCINRALEQVDTKVVCIYDVDVLIPLNSIETSYKKIIEDNFDMILPYTYGPYQKMILNYQECKNFKNTLNFDEFKTVQANASFYGHVQFFNTNSYRDMGGENEDIIGWGPEDQEKLYKMHSFGYKIKYLENSYVWHIEHEKIDPNVEQTDNYIKNMNIFDTIKNMSTDEKLNYYQIS